MISILCLIDTQLIDLFLHIISFTVDSFMYFSFSVFVFFISGSSLDFLILC